MITYLKGDLIEKNLTDVVIECKGVGYLVNISLHTYHQIKTKKQLLLYTYLHIREDAHILYGFKEKSEREVFKLLISVSGVGTNTARNMLSSLSPTQIQEGIIQGNISLIKSIKGIGEKTAKRIILDIKDKILKVSPNAEVSEVLDNTNKEQALSALEVLGFARKQSERAVNKALSTESDLSVEKLIKYALKNL